MAVARKIAYNVVFNVVAKVLSTILALVGIGFITRYLGAKGFGDYSTVLAFFAFFAAIADLGLYSIATREISRPNADVEKIVGNVFALRLVTSTILLAIIPFFVFFLPYSFDVKVGIVLAAAAFIFSSGYSVLNGVFQKNLAMDKIALVELLGKILQVGIVIIAVRKDLGFTIIIFSLLASMVFNFAAAIFLARRYVKISLRFDFPYWKKFFHEALPMAVSSVIIFAYYKMDTILLSIMKTGTEVGLYNAAYKVVDNITFFPSMIMGLIFPIISHHIISDKQKFHHISNETLKVFVILVVPLVVGTLFLSNGIINIIGGSAFHQSAITLRILVFALAAIFFGVFFSNVLLAGNQQKKLMYTLSLCAVFNVTCNVLFIPIYSYNGSAVISALTEILVAASSLYLTVTYVGYAPKISHFFRILFSGCAMAAFLYLFQKSNFFVLALSGVAVYMFFLWLTRTIKTREIMDIVAAKD